MTYLTHRQVESICLIHFFATEVITRTKLEMFLKIFVLMICAPRALRLTTSFVRLYKL